MSDAADGAEAARPPGSGTVPTARRVLALAVPVMLSNASVPLVGIADTAVAGRLGSPDYLSATAVGAVLFSSIFWVFGFLRMGTGGLVAQAFGAGDPETIRRTAWRAIAVALAIGLLLVALQKPLLLVGLALMDTAAWGPLAATYFGIRILAAPATLLTYALLGVLVGCQRTPGVLVLQLVLNLANVALNVALFALTDLGIAGVAIATLAAEWLAAGVGLWLLRDVLRPSLPSAGESGARAAFPVWLLEREPLARFARIGSDLFVRTLCLTAAFYWLTASGSRQGAAVLAANAVLLQLLHLMAHCLDGFAHAAETLVGAAIGRRAPARARPRGAGGHPPLAARGARVRVAVRPRRRRARRRDDRRARGARPSPGSGCRGSSPPRSSASGASCSTASSSVPRAPARCATACCSRSGRSCSPPGRSCPSSATTGCGRRTMCSSRRAR